MDFSALWAWLVQVSPDLLGFVWMLVVSYLKKGLATSKQKVWLTVMVLVVAAAARNYQLFLTNTACETVPVILGTFVLFFTEAGLLYKTYFEDSTLEQLVMGKVSWKTLFAKKV